MQYKLYIIGENITFENNTRWICDVFKDEFISGLQYINSNISIVNTIDKANIIWILTPWIVPKMNIPNLQNKIIVTTIHHIDWNKYDKFVEYFSCVDKITTYYHAICSKIEHDLKKITNKKIILANFWINTDNFIKKNNISFRQKYNIPNDRFVVGSFQRDTEGKLKCIRPKLSKGPDIFMKIVYDMKENGKNPFVLLTGRRRNYIINELQRCNIDYLYLEMVQQKELVELYQCLNLYIVSSRIEGGPRSIIECAILKVPIISTNVGISELILSSESIYDINDYLSYKNAIPNIDYAYNKAIFYDIKNYLPIFIDSVFLCQQLTQ